MKDASSKAIRDATAAAQATVDQRRAELMGAVATMSPGEFLKHVRKEAGAIDDILCRLILLYGAAEISQGIGNKMLDAMEEEMEEEA